MHQEQWDLVRASSCALWVGLELAKAPEAYISLSFDDDDIDRPTKSRRVDARIVLVRSGEVLHPSSTMGEKQWMG